MGELCALCALYALLELFLDEDRGRPVRLIAGLMCAERLLRLLLAAK